LIIMWPTSWHKGRLPEWETFFTGNCLTRR